MGVALGVEMGKRIASVLLFVGGIAFLMAFALICVWFELFGHEASVWLRGRYAENAPVLLQIGKVVGGAGTLVTGLFGLFKAWRHAEFNLPDRLHDFLVECKKSVLLDREVLIGEMVKHYAEPPQQANWILPRNWFARRSGTPEACYRALDDRIDFTGENEPGVETVLKQRVKALDDFKRENELQLATACLLQGLDKVYQADRLAAGGTSQFGFESSDVIELRKAAILKLREAAKHDSSEYRAFEQAVDQANKIKEFDQARLIATQWTQAAVQHDEPFQNARSLRFAAETDCKRSVDPSLLVGQRRGYLMAAQVSLVQGRGQLIEAVPNTDHRKGLELGRTYQLLGQVRIKRGATQAGIADLRRAREFLVLHGTKKDVEDVDDDLSGSE